MHTICPNCDIDVEVMKFLYAGLDVPTCGSCGYSIYGFSYTLCPSCNMLYRSDLYACPICGKSSEDTGNGANVAAELHSREPDTIHYGSDALDSSNGKRFTIDPLRTGDHYVVEVISERERMSSIIAELAGQTLLSIDTETSGLDPHCNELLLLQIATQNMVYVFDCTAVNITPLKELLENPQSVKLLQNAKFDYQFLKAKTGISLTNIFDTMLAERLLTVGISREISLANLAKKYLGIKLDKSIRLSFTQGVGHLSRDQISYAAEDVITLIPIYSKQRELLAREDLQEIAKLEFDAVVPIAEMELNGVLIDADKWRVIIKREAELRDKAQQELLELLKPGLPQMGLFGDISPANVNSSTQMIEIFGRMGITLPDTSEATLKDTNHPAAAKLLEYREHEKVVTAFGESFLNLINPVTGRIHPNFQQYGADTGRLSCQKPNLQQIPSTEEFRSCFIPRPDYKIITCDYSQAELRILAQLSKDDGFVGVFNSGEDLHSITASKMFKVPVGEVSKKLRGQAKAINFGLAYGMGPMSLAARIEVSLEEAEQLIAQYFEAYPKIGQWLDRAANDAVALGYSLTPMGRKRYFRVPDEMEPEYKRKIGGIQRQGKNTPIQGANADMTKLALIYIQEQLWEKNYDAKLINTVHDEIVVEAREDLAEEVKGVVEEMMINAAQQIVKVVPIVADATLADCWQK